MRRYPGLAPFTADQKDVFFGRKNDIQELSELIFVERKVLLYSKSGYGKTSLLNAGVVPKLSDNKDFEFITIRFRSYTEKNITPHQTFLQALRQHTDFNFSDKPETIIDKYAPQQKENYWAVFKKNQLLGNKHKTYILIFDQFEELFTYPETQINEFKQRFAEIILEKQLPHFFDEFEDAVFDNKENIPKQDIDLLYNTINIKGVFAMRSDRLSELNALADKITDIQKVFYELQPLNKEQAKQAIINPAKQEGDFESQPFTYEKTALEKIINALAGKGKIETTQLQIVCQRIEENIIAKNLPSSAGQGSVLNVVESDIPDFKDIFLDFYNSAVAKVKTDDINSVRKFIEDQLIIEGRRISLDEFVCQRYIKNETLKTLVETRLLRAERNSVEGFSYELSHDTLVPPIKEIADKRRDEEEKERLRAKQRRQIRIIVLAVLISVISIGAAIFGIWQKSIAEKERKKAVVLLEQNQKKDSLNRIEKFNRFWAEAEKLETTENYIEAINKYEFSKEFTNDTVKVNANIKNCEDKYANLIKFNSIINKANEEIKKGVYSKAILLYEDAVNLEISQQKLKSDLKDLKNEIEKLIVIEKQNANALSYDVNKAKPYWQKVSQLNRFLLKINNLINQLK